MTCTGLHSGQDKAIEGSIVEEEAELLHLLWLKADREEDALVCGLVSLGEGQGCQWSTGW